MLWHKTQTGFGLDPIEAEIVARKGQRYIQNQVSRTEEQVIIQAVHGKNNHQKRSFKDLAKSSVNVTVFSHDDLSLLHEFGLETMQRARLARIIEEIYYQNALLPLEQLSFLLNTSIRPIRLRLMKWWDEKIIMPICGQNKSTRDNCIFLRPVYCVRKHFNGQNPDELRKFLAITKNQYNDYLFSFSKAAYFIRNNKDYQKLARSNEYPVELLQQWDDLYHEVNPYCPELIDSLIARFNYRLSLLDSHESHNLRDILLNDLQKLHNFSPAKAESYIFSLDEHCELLSGYSRSPLDVIYYAVSAEEPANRSLAECELIPTKITYLDFNTDILSRDKVREMKWIKLLRYATQTRKQGALLTNCDLGFLLGIDPDIVANLMKEHPETFVPTRGNIADIGPKLTHVDKIISCFMEGYTETEIMGKTGHSRESVENYILNFCITAGLLERGLTIPLIRQVTKKSKRLIECHKRLYDKYNVPDYQFTMMRVRQVFAHQESLLSKKKNGMKEGDHIKRPSRKINEIYKPLLDKGLEYAQQQFLAEFFDFNKVSWLAHRVTTMFNSLMEEYETSKGVNRLNPGDLKATFRTKPILLPLCPTSLIKELANGLAMEHVFQKHCEYLLDFLKTIDSTASITDIHIIADQRRLLPCRKQPKRPQMPLPDFNIENLLRKRQVSSTKGYCPIPDSIRDEIVDTLIPDGVSNEKANAIVDSLAQIRNGFCPLFDELKPGQIVWNAISAKDRQQDSFYNMFRRQVPVILTFYTPEELLFFSQPNIDLGLVDQMHKRRITRMCFEAYHQGGLLSTLDLQMLILRSTATVSRLINEFEHEYNIIIPTPGSIKDAGRKFTHKRIVIDLHLQGYLSKEVARKTYHSGTSVDRYIDGFLRVMALELFNVPPKLIARTTHMGLPLVEEYLSIIHEHFTDKEVLQNHLREHGIAIS